MLTKSLVVSAIIVGTILGGCKKADNSTAADSSPAAPMQAPAAATPAMPPPAPSSSPSAMAPDATTTPSAASDATSTNSSP